VLWKLLEFVKWASQHMEASHDYNSMECMRLTLSSFPTGPPQWRAQRGREGSAEVRLDCGKHKASHSKATAVESHVALQQSLQLWMFVIISDF
jgi:hypothetical protein